MSARRNNAVAFLVSDAEHRMIKAAAADVHLNRDEYCRLMVLAAAGMGGALEHLIQAIDASWKAVLKAEENRDKRSKASKPARKVKP